MCVCVFCSKSVDTCTEYTHHMYMRVWTFAHCAYVCMDAMIFKAFLTTIHCSKSVDTCTVCAFVCMCMCLYTVSVHTYIPFVY